MTHTHRTLTLSARVSVAALALLALGACGDDTGTGAAAGGETSSDAGSSPAVPDESTPPVTDPSTSDAPTTDPSTEPTTDPSSEPTTEPTTEPKLIPYAGGESAGAEITKPADVKLLGKDAPEAFKTFIADTVRTLHKDTACTDGFIGVTVEVLRTDGYAAGGVNDCGGYQALWADVDGTWKEIYGTQDTWDCAVLKKYTVPSDVVGDTCYAYEGDHKEHEYHQA
ncbi:hypothetical protein BH11ACT8_BH11ACT8_22640 [soil metagenome]